MKNLVLSALCLVLLIVGCKKQDIKPISNSNTVLAVVDKNNTLPQELKEKVSVKNNMLAFEDRASYESAIEYLLKLEEDKKDFLTNWDNQLCFTSLNQQKTEKELDKLGIFDPILAALLNLEQKIQIEDDIFEMDMLNENVNVLNLSSNKTETFSTDDNYFDIKDGITTERGAKALCPYKDKNIVVGLTSAKVVYQRAGIYYSLQSKIKNSGSANIYLKSLSGSFYVKNKYGATAENIPIVHRGGTGREYNYRPYASATRRLRAYSFRVEFGYNQSTNVGRIDC